jgi:hypothetical protein
MAAKVDATSVLALYSTVLLHRHMVLRKHEVISLRSNLAQYALPMRNSIVAPDD